MAPIKLIALDLDGTLLNSHHQLTARTEAALKQAMARGIQVILATGKTRISALETIQRLNLTTPGVYLQGLAIFNSDGTIRHQQTLQAEVARLVAEYAEANRCSLVAYNGDRILTESRNPYTDIIIKYAEPTPEAVGPLSRLTDTLPIHKFMFIDEPAKITAIRTELSAQINGVATLTQALHDMLEVLPPGASKGAGLKRLLEDLQVAPEDVLAIGDGENDIEMIQLAGIGVAVGNAMPITKAAADYVVASNDEDGVAEAVERFVLAN